MIATLILGTNLGDREENLKEAIRRLSLSLGDPLEASDPIETEALGFDGPAFLNQIIRFECKLEPECLLAVCKKIEKSMGRTDRPEYRSGKRIYHDRIMDIDILTYGDLVISTPELTIPHPQMETRPYVKALLERMD